MAACALTAATPDYLPLEPGNQWVYRSSWAGASDTWTMEVVRTEVVDGKVYSVVQNTPGGSQWLRMGRDGTLYLFDPASKREQVWADFGEWADRRYQTAVDPCNHLAFIDSRRWRYSGPVGEFRNALRIEYPPSGCADAGLTEEIFLPYVGLLRRSSTTIAGPRRYDLIYARLGGNTVISEQHVAFGLTLDKPVYTVNLMPPVDLRRAIPEMTARLTLRSAGHQPIELTYPSGQTFDLVLKNEKGEVVYRWSEGKAFTLALRTEKFGPGEKNLPVVVRLAGKDGQPLAAGKYVAEGWLATMGQRAWSASAGFEIQHVH